MNIPKKLAVAAAIAMLGTLTLKTALAGEVTIYTALEDDEVADYMDAAKKAMPDVTFHVLRLSTGDMAARLLAEAGNPQTDVVWGFAVTNMLDPRIQAILTPYLPHAAELGRATVRGQVWDYV